MPKLLKTEQASAQLTTESEPAGATDSSVHQADADDQKSSCSSSTLAVRPKPPKASSARPIITGAAAIRKAKSRKKRTSKHRSSTDHYILTASLDHSSAKIEVKGVHRGSGRAFVARLGIYRLRKIGFPAEATLVSVLKFLNRAFANSNPQRNSSSSSSGDVTLRCNVSLRGNCMSLIVTHDVHFEVRRYTITLYETSLIEGAGSVSGKTYAQQISAQIRQLCVSHDSLKQQLLTIEVDYGRRLRLMQSMIEELQSRLVAQESVTSMASASHQSQSQLTIEPKKCEIGVQTDSASSTDDVLCVNCGMRFSAHQFGLCPVLTMPAFK